MKVEGQINYEMLINEPAGQHGIGYESSLDSNLAALMIAAQAMDVNLNMLKEQKKLVAGPQKKIISKSISEMSLVLRGLNKFAMSICESYEDYQKEISQK
jgi:hypothetical protein